MSGLIPATFFASRGILQIYQQFLKPESCRKLIEYVKSSELIPAPVYEEPIPGQTARKTSEVEVPYEIKRELADRVYEQLGFLNQAFNCQATQIQMMQVLRYDVGDYFRPHRDWGPELEQVTSRRLISFVLFINTPDDPEFGYSGGELVFHLPQRNGMTVGLPLQPEAGLLIAFDPLLMHEVREITAGVRLSVAGWLS